MDNYLMDDVILRALKEDINHYDVTTEALSLTNEVEGTVKAKASGIIAGGQVFKRVFELVDPTLDVTIKIPDGQYVKKGDEVISFRGMSSSLLKAERVALNFMQRMSGIATMANRYCEVVEDLGCRIVDTRKTTPGLRYFEKYAVRIGGAFNHRYNLSDAVMIKDNHIRAIGSIEEALRRVKKFNGHTVKVEIEVKNIEEFLLAQKEGADIIMLDNMSFEDMKSCVVQKSEHVILEASGGITLETLREVALTGINVISIGALTHSYQSLDLSMNFKEVADEH